MAGKEKQSKVGRSTKLRGRRKQANEMFGDKSTQHVGGDAATPRSNTPSVPAAMPKKVKR